MPCITVRKVSKHRKFLPILVTRNIVNIDIDFGYDPRTVLSACPDTQRTCLTIHKLYCIEHLDMLTESNKCTKVYRNILQK
jgi:hypothetical protein